MSSEQVLRALLIKQLNGFGYEQLAFHLEDSLTYRTFCRFGLGQATPTRSTLQSNIKRIAPSTLEMMNRMIVREAIDRKVETCARVRIDRTVIDTKIQPHLVARGRPPPLERGVRKQKEEAAFRWPLSVVAGPDGRVERRQSCGAPPRKSTCLVCQCGVDV